jgi:hypothetical protein
MRPKINSSTWSRALVPGAMMSKWPPLTTMGISTSSFLAEARTDWCARGPLIPSLFFICPLPP